MEFDVFDGHQMGLVVASNPIAFSFNRKDHDEKA
jgi:hypothetical protein